MEAWLIWLLAALVLAGLEVLTGGTLVFLMLGSAALAGSLMAAVGADPGWQVAAFLAVAIATLVGIRPVARRHLKQPARVRDGVAALIGRSALVTQTVDSRDGRIKVNGETWSARAYDQQSTYTVDTEVQILSIDGATALVA